ncbi:hypothetical protein AWW66_01840 [Micromonospora rosaria]|uniref:DUF6603 domain-containing protein n=1 Tax=Micromonospora rosaria TaxID=47874 RepID=A0A136PZU6_9ACTN|nr:DUF6603 domain-containing protein [Micromonospora rosaria]KXK63726.1 hypothetical protein AWW66_01840 [Micromonospora rosaria]
MTPEALETLLAGVPSGRLDLPVAALDPSAAAYLGRFLPAGRLALTGCVRAEAANPVTVTGTGSPGPFERAEVTLRFTLTGDVVSRVEVIVRPGSDWSLADTFPPLRGTLLDTLRFSGAVLRLDTDLIAESADPPDPTATPLAFEGDLLVRPGMELVGLLFPGESHPLSGEVTMTSLAPPEITPATPLVPSVALYGPADAGLDLGLFTLTTLRYGLFGLPELNYNTLDHQVRGALVIAAGIPVSAGSMTGLTEDHKITIDARLASWSEELVLTADFSGLGPLTLADIAGLVGLETLPVPFGIDPGAGITLGAVTLAVDPTAANPVDYLTMTLYTEADWVVIPGLLTLQQIDLTVRVVSPGPSAQVSVLVSGLFGIGADGTLELVADSTTRRIGGGLRADDPPLRIREVYRHFTGDEPDHVPDLTVTRFQAGAVVPSATVPASFDGEIVLDGVWRITEQVTVTQVGFDLLHDPTGTTFHARAGLLLGGVAVMVRAGYDPDPGRRWEFAGETGPGEEIPIGRLFADLADRFGGLALPAPLAESVVDNLAAEVSTGAGRLFLTGRTRFPVDGTDVALTLAVDTARRSVAGTLDLAVPVQGGTFHPTLELHFAQDPTARRLAASYRHLPADPVPDLKALVGALSPTAAAHVPEGIRLDLRQALFALSGNGTRTGYLFGVEVAATLDLGRLPVVGDHLRRTTMGVDPLRLLAATTALPAAEAAALAALLPAGFALPAGDLAAGFTVDATLLLGPFTQALAVPVGGPPGVAPAPATGAPAPVRTGDDATWLTVQRSFGPLHISRVGLAWRQSPGQEARIALLLDASVTVAGLTLSLSGLAIGVSATNPLSMPTFDLAGIGLAYDTVPLRIGGALRKDMIEYEGVRYPAYSGGLSVRTPTFSVGAMGAYVQLPAGPSLFAYAYLNGLHAGPPALSLRGLAGGFGYNRRFIAPAIDQVAGFPLVADAITGPPPGTTLADELRILADYLPPSVGDYFLALGLRVNSFEMVDAFLLVAAAFGHRFELDVLGMATVVLPAPDAGAGPVSPVAQIQLAIRATLVPDDGYLAVEAQLTRASYLLAPDCHLTGGFAFATWFTGEHAGDFALTAGGYHPQFPVPAHYPTVPRLGFAWQVTKQFSISGAGYFALTPTTLMAGGRVTALWQDDSLRAGFDASMDFLISWQPYHYEASLHVSIGVSYTFSLFGTHTLSVQVGTDVQLWGPDFGGTAAIDLGIVTMRISFGSAGGAKPEPVSWDRFRDTLLPPRDRVLGLSVRADTHRAAPDAAAEDLGIVDPATLVVSTTSAIPASGAVRGTREREVALPTGGGRTAFGVGPADLAPGAVTAVHRIVVTHEGLPVEDRFDYTPVRQGLPFALWGGRLAPQVTDPALVEDLVTGYELRPRPPSPARAVRVDRSALTADTPLYTREVITLAPPPRRPVVPDGPAARASTIRTAMADPGVAATRSAVAAALLPSAVLDTAGFDTTQFHAIPQVAAHV